MHFIHISFIRTHREKGTNMRQKIKDMKILIEYNIDSFNNDNILNIITMKKLSYSNCC